MTFSVDEKRRLATLGPLDCPILRADTEVIARPGWYQLRTPSTRGSYLNEVVLSEVAEEDADRVIDDVARSYFQTGHSLKWYVGPSTRPTDFAERLARRGYESTALRAMLADTALPIEAPDGARIEEVGAGDIEAYVDAQLRGWSMAASERAPELAMLRGALAADERTAHCFAAIVDGDVVATSALFTKGDHAYLLGAQVLPRYRGRGLYRALVCARLRFLHNRGIGLALTHASDATSAPILERLGFEVAFPMQCFFLVP